MTVNLNFDPAESRESFLANDFHFDLGDHELIDPQTNRGRVVGFTEIDTSDATERLQKSTVYEVEVEDPFVDADPAGYMLVNDYVAHMESRLRQEGFAISGDRQEALSLEDRNEYTNAWLSAPNMAGLSVWRSLVPTAVALEYLTNPTQDIIAAREGTAKISNEVSAHFRFVDDAVAIRDRAVAMQDIAEAHIAELRDSQDTVRWLSLASGTAEPAIAAIKAAQERAEQDGADLHADLTVADMDGRSLRYVKTNAERYGFEDKVNTVRQNILVPTLGEDLAAKTGNPELYDVVENMGFEEYLPQDGDEIEAKKDLGLPQASEFTRRAFELVKPGGVLISGNMILDRPQIDFVFGVVDWPIINARSEESILRVYEEAGILDDPNAKVEMYRVKNSQTGSHVYNIVKVTKLAQ